MVKLEQRYVHLLQGITLTKEQIEGVEFLINKLRAVLAFQTGLGKTVTGLVALKVLMDKYDTARGIIICPVKAVKIFKKELTQKLGYDKKDIGLITNQEMDYDVRTNKIYIFTNTSIAKYYSLIEELAVHHKLILLLDEAHQMQDNKSKFYTLMIELQKYFVVIWFATATPLLNDLESLYNLITFLDKNFFGTKTNFFNNFTHFRLKDIYVKGGKKRKVRDITGYKNLDVLKARLEKLCIMRQKQYNLEFVNICDNLTDDELKIYERVSAGIVGDEDRSFGQRLHDLQRLIDNSYQDEMVCIIDNSTKERLLINALKSIMAQDFSAVVYIDYLDTVDRVEKILKERKAEIGYRELFQIKGSISLAVRERVEDEIKERDIILVTRAGTESINLQKANCVVMYDIPYSIKDCIQLIGRVTRMDTKHSSQYIITIWTKGTIDEYKYLLFQDYANLVKKILGSDANLPQNLGEIDRKNLQKLKDKLLWHYKDGDRKLLNRKKKLLKSKLIVCKVEEVEEYIATYRISLNPDNVPVKDAQRINILTPNLEDYNSMILGTLPFSVMRTRYIDKLKSDEGMNVLNTLGNEVANKGSVVVLVDDYGIGKILKDFILENFNLEGGGF